MFDARLQRTELEIIDPGFDERVEPLFQEIKERELVTAAGSVGNIDERN